MTKRRLKKIVKKDVDEQVKKIKKRNKVSRNTAIPGYGMSSLRSDVANLDLTNPSGSVVVPDSELAERYAKCLVFPYDNACGLPDNALSQSHVFRTRKTFTVSVPNTEASGAGRGRFAFFVQPKLGDPADPQKFKIGRVNFSNGIPINLQNPSVYDSLSAQATSLAVDPNAPVLTQPSPFAIAIRNTSVPAYPAPPFQGGGDWNPSANLPFTYNSTYSLADGIDTWSSYSILRPGFSGSCMIVVYTKTNNTAASSRPVELSLAKVNSTDTTLGVLVPIFSEGTGEKVQAASYALALTPGDALRFKTVNSTDSLSSIWVTVTPLWTPNYALDMNYGMIEKIRPVGLSVLTTSIASSLTNGGTISATLTPGAALDKVFTTPGVWLRSEDMSYWNTYYTGDLKQGSYVWWKPADDLDRQFRSVEEMNAYQYPVILVSGQVSSDALASGSATLTPIQVTVEFVYEISQNTQLFPDTRQVGSSAAVTLASKAVHKLTNLTENPKHSTLLSDVAKVIDSGAKFLPFLMSIL